MDIGAFNFAGLASGIDTKALVDAILSVERRPIERLQQREFELNQRKSAFDDLRSKLNGFLTTLRDISSDRTFRGRVTTVSDESILGASAGTAAESGLFSIDVLELAAANKVASTGLSASDEGLVADGTLTLQSGSSDPLTIDVGAASGNNSLQAIRDAINSADAGVAASILYDGADYRLLVRAEETGLDNALTISDSTNLGLDNPANELVAAADARITVDTIEITQSSNKISGVIEGVTLDLLQVTSGTPVTLQVADDVEGAVEAVSGLVEAYNEAIDFFNEQLDRDDPGPLAGDSFTRRLQSTLQSLVSGGVEGIPLGGIRSLSSIGVSFDGRSGRLSLDSAELTELLEERFDEVGELFLTSGSAANPFVSFLSAGPGAVAGEYAVEVSQAAERAGVVGSRAIRANGLRNDETLTIAVNGQDVVVDLLDGQRIAEVVDTINAALASAGVDAEASDDAGALRLTTGGYGSDQTISVTSNLVDRGNGRQSGFDVTATTDEGLDVAGRIGGLDAEGAGRTLTAPEGSEFSGLTALITATAADVTAAGGDFGTISFSAGLTQRLIAELKDVTRVGDGSIESSQEIIDDQLRRISDDVRRLDERLLAREARLVRRFAAAERAISLLQAQQNSLGGFTPR